MERLNYIDGLVRVKRWRRPFAVHQDRRFTLWDRCGSGWGTDRDLRTDQERAVVSV